MSDRLKTHWFHILLALADGEKHGTAIMEEVLDRTEGAVRLWPGILYGSLKQLVAEGLIEDVDPPPGAPTEGGKRRFYKITGPGRVALHDEVERMAALVSVARRKRIGRSPGRA